MSARRPPGAAIPVDGLFDALSDERRRLVADCLLRQNGPMEIERLADHVVAETRRTSSRQRDESRERELTRLHHVDVPKLEAAGLVTYEVDRGIVKPTDDAPIAIPYLELARTHDSR